MCWRRLGSRYRTQGLQYRVVGWAEPHVAIFTLRKPLFCSQVRAVPPRQWKKAMDLNGKDKVRNEFKHECNSGDGW